MQRRESETSDSGMLAARQAALIEIQRSSIKMDIFWRNMLGALEGIPILLFLACFSYVDPRPLYVLGVTVPVSVTRRLPLAGVLSCLCDIAFVLLNSYRRPLYRVFILSAVLRFTVLGVLVYNLLLQLKAASYSNCVLGLLITYCVSVVVSFFVYFGERFSYRQRQGFRQATGKNRTAE